MEQNQTRNQQGINWVKGKIVKSVVGFMKEVVAQVVSPKGKILNVSGDVLGKFYQDHWVSVRM